MSGTASNAYKSMVKVTYNPTIDSNNIGECIGEMRKCLVGGQWAQNTVFIPGSRCCRCDLFPTWDDSKWSGVADPTARGCKKNVQSSRIILGQIRMAL